MLAITLVVAGALVSGRMLVDVFLVGGVVSNLLTMLILARDQHGLAVSFGLLLGVVTRSFGRTRAMMLPGRLDSDGETRGR